MVIRQRAVTVKACALVAGRWYGLRERGSVAADRETSTRRSHRGPALARLRRGDRAAAGCGVTRIGEMLGREKSQVSRALKTLAEFGLVERNPDALSLPARLAHLRARQLAGERRLLDDARPRLRRARRADAGARVPLRPAGRRRADAALRVVRPRRRGRRLGRARDAGLLHLGRPGAAPRPRPRGARARCFADVELPRLAPNTPTDLDALAARIEDGARARLRARRRGVRGWARRRPPRRCATARARSSPRSTSRRRSSASDPASREASRRASRAPAALEADDGGTHGSGRGDRHASVIGRAAVGTGPASSASCAGTTSRTEVAGTCALLADLAAVCVAGRPAPASLMAADYASAVHPGDEPRRCSTAAAVGAVARRGPTACSRTSSTTTTGTASRRGIPARRDPRGARRRAARRRGHGGAGLAVVVGYEIALRAGVAAPRARRELPRVGAWGGLGAAAAAARLLGLDEAQTAPRASASPSTTRRSRLMRSVASRR